jgi:quercetin dioxygenase-like cupin family protein
MTASRLSPSVGIGSEVPDPKPKEGNTMKATTQRFERTEQVTRFPKGEERVLDMLGLPVGLATFEPGWRWSNDVRPLAGTHRCGRLHAGYALSGQLHVEFADGSVLDVAAGDLFTIPPEHDAWVVGDEAVVLLDWSERTAR